MRLAALAAGPARLALLALTTIIAAAPGVAAADSNVQDLLAHLDADAWLIVRLEPEQLARMAAIAAVVGIDVARWWSTTPIGDARDPGFDPALASAWRGIGVEPESPVLYQERAGDRDDADAVTQTRLILTIDDADRARAGITRGWRLTPVTPSAARRRELATGLEVPAGDAGAIGARLRARSIFGVRRDGNGWLIARIAGEHVAVIDHIASTRRQLTWKAHRALLFGIAERRPDAHGKDLTRPARRLLGSEGITIWLDAAGMANAGPEIRAQWTRCAPLRQIAGTGTFESIAVRARIGSRLIDGDVEWAVRPDSHLDDALATADDALAPPRGKTVSLALYTTGTRALRDLPRPEAFPPRWEDLSLLARDCGPTGASVAMLFGWPQMIGLYLDEVAGLDVSADRAVTGARNLVVAADTLSWDPERMVGLVELSMDDPGRRAVHRYLDAVFGGRTRRTSPRSHLRWNGALVQPYSFQLGRRWRIGAGVGGADVEARIGTGPKRRPRPSAIAELAVNVERALTDLGAGRASKLASARFGTWIDARLSLAQGSLTAHISTASR